MNKKITVDNICGSCYFFENNYEILDDHTEEDKQGMCNQSNKKVWYQCKACKHFLKISDALETLAREHAYTEFLKKQGYHDLVKNEKGSE